MGQVFLGRSPGGRPVAVKLVRPEYAADSRFRKRFAVEAEAARRVGGFYTAQVVDADPDANPPWLVTAYVAGPSLHTAVREHGPFPVGTLQALGAGLVEGLLAIHASGVVHRDLKPSNIIIASDGPRVIDFGIARALEGTSLPSQSAVLGTPGFMSPEQVLAREHGPAGDVFALGAVLTFAATGRPGVAAARHAGPCRQLRGSGGDRRRPAPGHPDPLPARSGPVRPVRRGRRSFREQPDYVRMRHRDQLDDLAVKLGKVLPIVEEYPRRRSHHFVDALSDVRLKVLNLSHFLGLNRRLPDTSSRDLARVLWKTIDQFIETAIRLEPIRELSDAHARKVAKAFAEAITALSAAADVNVPDASSVFDDHD